MKTEKEIIHRIKRLKYMAQRYSYGFDPQNPDPRTLGSPLDMLSYMHAARQLEWAISKKIEVKKVNWYQAALRVVQKGKQQ